MLSAVISKLELGMQLQIMRFHADMRIQHICGFDFPHMRISFKYADNLHIDMCGLFGYAHYAHVFSEPHM